MFADRPLTLNYSNMHTDALTSSAEPLRQTDTIKSKRGASSPTPNDCSNICQPQSLLAIYLLTSEVSSSRRGWQLGEIVRTLTNI